MSLSLGLFMMPTHPPERSLYDATNWDLTVIRWAEELGYQEVWIGEHFTSPWEPIPSPDLIIAQALRETKRIVLAPGAHLLPYHHPVELAHRVAYLDHLAQGRLIFGIGAGGLPSDWKLYNVDGFAGEHRRMTAEALDIILKLWTEEGPFEYHGKYWSMNKIDEMVNGLLKHHIYPYQKPHPPIGITGLSYGSETLKLAGERGFIPLSFGANNEYVASHWNSILEGAKRSGRTPNRKDWRIVREAFVAETDEEAWEWSVGFMMGRQSREYYLPLFTHLGGLRAFKHDPSVPDEAVTPEYLAQTGWLIGSPETVARKLQNLYDMVGGFGTFLIQVYDYSEEPEKWRNSMRLMVEEVLPRLKV